MTFDPFGDFASRGYLRNSRGYKRAQAIKRFEHKKFEEKLGVARTHLQRSVSIDYARFLETHRILFGTVYPWAGQDRAALGLTTPIFKGRLHFAGPDRIERIASQALKLAADPAIIARQPGMILAELAYAHPFLEGNGRTILTVHAELARRSAIWIDWRVVPLRDYLIELTKEIVLPGSGCLDDFLAPFVRPNPSRTLIEDHRPLLG